MKAEDKLGLDFGRDKKFYVYLYRDPRSRAGLRPIYVGKGTAKQKRADFHWKIKAANPFLSAILDKIRAAKLEPIIEIVSWFDIEADAFALECALIAKFGRRNTGTGTLTNLTDGGDGASGYIPTDAERAMSSVRMKKTRSKQSEDPAFLETCIRNLNAGRDRMRSNPALRNLSSARRVETMQSNPDKMAKTKRKMSESQKALMENAEYKAAAIAAMTNGRRSAWAADPEKRSRCSDKIRDATNRSWSDPKFRENLVKKNSATVKAKWADPDYRSKQGAKLSALFKAAWADPEKRALMLANRAKRHAEKKAAARG